MPLTEQDLQNWNQIYCNMHQLLRERVEDAVDAALESLGTPQAARDDAGADARLALTAAIARFVAESDPETFTFPERGHG